MNVNELVTLHQSGDKQAGWQLVMSQERLLRKAIGGLNLNAAVDPEDVLHEMYIVILKELLVFDPSRLQLPGFVLMVFWRRVTQVVTSLSGIPSIPLQDVCVHHDHTDHLESQELSNVILDALAKVRPIYREIFLMDASSLPREHIADRANAILGREAFNSRNVKSLIQDSWAAVKIALGKDFVDSI